jgi:glycogen synthase
VYHGLRTLSQMRIVHFSWEYPPVMYGGLGTHVLELTREQVRAGHDVVVVTQQIEGQLSADTVDEHGVRVIRVSQSEPRIAFDENSFEYWSHRFAMDSFAQTRAVLTDWSPDLVHGHDWIAAEQTFLSADMWGVPSAITIHATEIGRHSGWLSSRLSKIVHARERAAVEQADSLIVCSTAMKSELVHNLCANINKIEVIPNGVCTDSPAAKRVDQVRSGDGFEVVFVGRLEWEKGIHHVIDALAVLNDSTIHFHVIGSGSQLSALSAKVTRKGLSESVTFHGYLSQEKMLEVLSKADAAVIPSSYEPFGIVALELGVQGIPLIVSKAGGLRETVPTSEFGYVLSNVDGHHIAALLQEIRADRSEAQKRSESLKHRIEQEFTWSHVAAETIEHYREILGSRVGELADARI